jgi:transposase-like protein
LGLSRVLGISYPATWNLLHKLRRAMIRPGRDPLTGIVEVDEAFFGGEAEGKPGRGADKKALVVLGVEVAGENLRALRISGRARLRVIQTASSQELLSFVQDNVEKGGTVIADGWRAYSQLKAIGCNHVVTAVKKNRDALPNVHRVISLIKRWLDGTLQGAVSKKNLEFYLDECAFRFNRRKSADRGKLFRRLMEQAVQVQPITWSDISGHPSDEKHHKES